MNKVRIVQLMLLCSLGFIPFVNGMKKTKPKTEKKEAYSSEEEEEIKTKKEETGIGKDIKKLNQLENIIVGAVLGGALGDAFGAPIEYVNMSKKSPENYEELKSNTKYKKKGFVKDIKDIKDIKSIKSEVIESNSFARYTDDTAMTKVVMEVLLRNHNKADEKIMEALVDGFITDMDDEDSGWNAEFRTPGLTCKDAVKKLVKMKKNHIENIKKLEEEEKYKEKIWWRAGEPNAGGNGSVMRVYPFGIVYKDDPIKAQRLAVEHSRLTHGSPMAEAACAAMTAGVIAILNQEAPEDVALYMIRAARMYDEETATMLIDAVKQAKETLKKIKDDEEEERVEQLIDASEDFYKKYKGFPAHEAIAAALYGFLVSPDNLQDAIILSANMLGDADTVAGLTGALVGLRVGAKGKIPVKWITGLEDGEKLVELGKKLAQLGKKK